MKPAIFKTKMWKNIFANFFLFWFSRDEHFFQVKRHYGISPEKFGNTSRLSEHWELYPIIEQNHFNASLCNWSTMDMRICVSLYI